MIDFEPIILILLFILITLLQQNGWRLFPLKEGKVIDMYDKLSYSEKSIVKKHIWNTAAQCSGISNQTELIIENSELKDEVQYLEETIMHINNLLPEGSLDLPDNIELARQKQKTIEWQIADYINDQMNK